MKKFFASIMMFYSLCLLGQGECVSLYVKKHYDGDRICLLNPGDALEICEKPGTACKKGGTINAGNCTYYIQNVRMSGDVITYDFGMDECTPWFFAPEYGKLIVNTQTQNFGFVIDNNSGFYSYINQADMERKQIEEENNKLQFDRGQYSKIELLLNENKITEARDLVLRLNYPNKYSGYNSVEERYNEFLLKEDKNKYSNINSLIQENKLSQARTQLNSLNFPNKYPQFKILTNKEDSVYTIKINEHLTNKQPEEAAKTYNSLNKKNADLKGNIQNALNQKYQNDTASLNTRILEQLIELNKDKFADLTAGKHTLLVSPDGKLSIIGNQNLNLNQPQRNVVEPKEIEGFNSIYLPSKGLLIVELKKINSNTTKICVSTEKEIRKKRNGKLYESTVWKGSRLHETISVSYSSGVPKNMYQVTKDVNTTVIVNGVNVVQKQSVDIIETSSFSKRIPTVISRVAIVSSGLFWGTLRAIEFLKIP
jgi:hypothetical protein